MEQQQKRACRLKCPTKHWLSISVPQGPRPQGPKALSRRRRSADTQFDGYA
jgi:hypothetical protein